MKLPYDYPVSFDLCVIGSGPAGIITALEYANLNPLKKVLLVEYGIGRQAENALDNSIQINNTVNHHPPFECTNKGLGGTSATWGGRCVMYDDIDFIDRPILNNGCTWDTDLFKEIQSFTPIAAKYFECGKPQFNTAAISGLSKKPIAEGFKQGIVTDDKLERYSMPTRFGKRYEAAIKTQKNLTLLEGYEARDFSEPDEHGKITCLTIREVSTKRLIRLSAGAFVLAAGAQESTRILLRNSLIFKNSGTPPPALGKYYQGHLSGKIASVKFNGDPNKTNYSFERDTDGTYVRRRFQFSSDFLKENNLLNTAIWLDNPLYFDPIHRSGAMSFMYLAMITPVLGKKLAPPAIAHSITKGKINKVGAHLGNIVKGLPGSVLKPAVIFYKRYCTTRKLPGIFLFSPENIYALHFHAEQIPFEGNCMKLDKDGETLIIDYSLTDEDISSVIKLHDVLDKWLRDCDCGELKYWFNENELASAIKNMSKDGLHQSGTTRIADTPDRGVVDKNLKVWGTDNIYVCSSSVFPTSGQANPTFLLGTFAARLAQHLTLMLVNKNTCITEKSHQVAALTL
ncbi:Choline dehydrogenase [Mucilaginibacter mallensis]|uniref:Choline dehydrogenase n=1 Tax=Mucilaginibacter mallensis TaxID=652787 RepID=A0A1H1X9W6_MUCMA|nr:GMC oxidoreductase [Mucilaginibacter mallensis]SDT06107.1 Choline dehydrogenase [Mucilaginibacter mallensis]